MKLSNIFIVRSVKSVIWLIVTVCCGLLLPMGLVWLDTIISPDKKFPFNQFVENGSFVFFATAVVTSITIDYILSEKFSNNWNLLNIFICKDWNFLEILALIVFPFLILTACVVLFYIPYYLPKPDINLLWTIEYYILLSTFFHGIIVKFHAFK